MRMRSWAVGSTVAMGREGVRGPDGRDHGEATVGAAGAFTAVGIGIATLFLTPLLFFLPKGGSW